MSNRRTDSNRIRQLEKEKMRVRQELLSSTGTIRSPDGTTDVTANDADVVVTIASTAEYTFRATDILVNGNALFNTSGGVLGLYDGTYYTGFSAPTLTANLTWELPSEDNNGEVYSDGSGTLAIRKDNLSASVDPSTTDDSSAGYTQRSLWFNTTASTIWMCLDNTASSAVWKQIG